MTRLKILGLAMITLRKRWWCAWNECIDHETGWCPDGATMAGNPTAKTYFDNSLCTERSVGFGNAVSNLLLPAIYGFNKNNLPPGNSRRPPSGLGTWWKKTITVKAHDVSGGGPALEEDIIFGLKDHASGRRNNFTICNFMGGGWTQLPGWTNAAGLPDATQASPPSVRPGFPSSSPVGENGNHWPDKAVLWLARLEDGTLWSGVFNDGNITNFPQWIQDEYANMGDSRSWGGNTSPAALVHRPREPGEHANGWEFDAAWGMNKLSSEILDTMKSDHNILLFGPPGTGKTYALQQLRKYITSNQETPRFEIDTDDPVQQIKEDSAALELDWLPGEEKTWWTTFHQSMSYEDFVVGLRPIPATGGSGIQLRPRGGMLLQAMMHALGSQNIASPNYHEPNTALIFVDELNRGNVERILGDFITAMDADKRTPLIGGSGSPLLLDMQSPDAIPITFATIDGTSTAITGLTDFNESEEVSFPDGTTTNLPLKDGGFLVPEPVYLICTMNSLDRSVKPLDSALERRFAIVKCQPDYDVLEKHAKYPNLVVHILKTINGWITNDLRDGEDMEIGHSYFMGKGKFDTREELLYWWLDRILGDVLKKKYRGQERKLENRLKEEFSLHENLESLDKASDKKARRKIEKTQETHQMLARLGGRFCADNWYNSRVNEMFEKP